MSISSRRQRVRLPPEPDRMRWAVMEVHGVGMPSGPVSLADRLARVTYLLQRAADLLGARSEHALAVSALVAAGTAHDLVPPGAVVPRRTPGAPGDPLLLLAEAEALTRRIDPRVRGVSALSAEVIDLLREAREVLDA